MNNTRGILTAGGHPVHRVRGGRPLAEVPPSQRVEAVPIVERYQDLAAAMHRTAVAPCGDRFLCGCVCGWYAKTQAGISSAAASLRAQQHVIDEAKVMFDLLEASDPEGDA